MATQFLEGTWEEVMRHGEELAGRKVRVTILEDENMPQPNEAMLEALRKISERSKNMPVSGGESSVDIIRRGRAGEMFGYESGE